MGSLIGITTARGMGPLPSLLERAAGNRAVERVFSKAGVPLEVIHKTDYTIPIASMIALFDHAAREAGDGYFGMRVGFEMGPDAYGKWTHYGAQAETLDQAIRRLHKTIWVHQNTGRFSLKSEGRYAVWTYIAPVSDLRKDRQHADHVIPAMIRFAQVYLGANWRPAIVRSYSDPSLGKSDARPCAAQNIEWRNSRKGVSIYIEKELLGTPRPFAVDKPLTSVDLFAELTATHAPSEFGEICALVSTRLLAGQTDLAGLAAFSGLSQRTLQRRLDFQGISYRKLIDRVRFQKALALLRETNTSLTNIALSLGYSDLAHFTRAFTRWAGVSPRALRQSLAA